MALRTKDLLGIKGMTADEIKLILDTAATFKDVSERDIKKVPALRGKTVINLFYEASTRTRTSFELAGKRLSADVINISTSTSSVVKGETLLDTARNLEAMKCNIIIVRHSCSGAPEYLARILKSSVINAGDGFHEHPTQALLDMFTIREKLGRLAGLTVAIVGDIAHSRVARSNIHGLTAMGAKVRVCGPPTMIPPGIECLGAEVTYDMDRAIDGADAVMMLRLQLERQAAGLFPGVREYARFYGLNTGRLAKAASHALVMHPGPMNRGVEISSEVADSTPVILDQVTNGVAVRMAVMFLLSGGTKAEA
ncbi:MAG TPA: aspartate carbamoyltransferase catalytic subunit [Nitrospirota bacterium]|nr:aspartate carbamoyltransferase catalytic subunit [Nitrospirota bacterium]